MCSSWWRTTNCANSPHDNSNSNNNNNSNDNSNGIININNNNIENNNNNNSLGFRGSKILRLNGGSRVSMGSVNGDDKLITGNDRVMSTLSSENHRNVKSKQNPADRLLTLPTILTIGRVAAIPVLVSSTLFFSFVFEYSCVF